MLERREKSAHQRIGRDGRTYLLVSPAGRRTGDNELNEVTVPDAVRVKPYPACQTGHVDLHTPAASDTHSTRYIIERPDRGDRKRPSPSRNRN